MYLDSIIKKDEEIDKGIHVGAKLASMNGRVQYEFYVIIIFC